MNSAGGSSSTTSSPQANKYGTRNDGSVTQPPAKYCRHKQQQNQGNLTLNQKTDRGGAVADSGKSSDSSISSGYRRLHDNNVGGSLRLSTSQQQQYKTNYRMLQESSSSHNIPHVAVACSSPRSRHHQHHQDEPDEDSLERKKPPPNLPFSLSNSTDLVGSSPIHSASTPQSKKKFHNDKHKVAAYGADAGSSKCAGGATAKQHQSFDFVGNPSKSRFII